ncbi:hypothetical protein HYV85_03965 [Candidatus Woesearchaeota archaeon]|nr:hypothetical protein [Candidatus Woesearchaeota archaeon]
MTQEKDFEVIELNGLKLIRFRGATAKSINSDVYWTQEIYCKYWGDYATQVPRFRPEYPTPQEFADESLEYILHRMWPKGLHGDVSDLLQKARVVAFEGHGNQNDEMGWYAHIHDGECIPVRELLNHFNSSGYETVLFGVCNPEKSHLEPQRGSVIYPLGDFGIEPNDFEIVVKTATVR